MATLTRQQTLLVRQQHPKRTRSLAFKSVSTTPSDAFELDPSPRQVLHPIHTNIRPIRKYPSRGMPALNRKISTTQSPSYSGGSQSPVDVPEIGSRKRKRPIVNGNENYDGSGRNGYGRTAAAKVAEGPIKRSKSAYASLGRTNSGMDVDDEPPRRASHYVSSKRPESPVAEEEVAEDEETDLEDEDAVDSCEFRSRLTYFASTPRC